MKQKCFLVGLCLLIPQMLFAQEAIPSIEVIGIHSYDKKTPIDDELEEKKVLNEGIVNLFSVAPLCAESKFGISTLVSVSTEGWMEGLIGPAFISKTFNCGFMIGFQNQESTFRWSPWLSFRSKDGHLIVNALYEHSADASFQRGEVWYLLSPKKSTSLKMGAGVLVDGTIFGGGLICAVRKISFVVAPYVFNIKTGVPATLVGINLER